MIIKWIASRHSRSGVITCSAPPPLALLPSWFIARVPTVVLMGVTARQRRSGFLFANTHINTRIIKAL